MQKFSIEYLQAIQVHIKKISSMVKLAPLQWYGDDLTHLNQYILSTSQIDSKAKTTWSSQIQKRSLKKIQNPLIIKFLDNLWIQGIYMSILKTIYNKAITNIMLSGKNLWSISTKVRNKTECPLSLMFNIVFEVLARAIRQVKETKKMQVGKNEVEIFLFAGNLIPYIRDTKRFNKTSTVDKHSAK